MVLKLKEICLTCIAKEFHKIASFDYTLLNTSHKEIIIERLINHSLINYENKFNSSNNVINNDLTSLNYRKCLIKNFFNGNLTSIKFNSCHQVDDPFLELIANQINVLKFKCLTINGCNSLTDNGIGKLISTYSSFLEELTLTNLNIQLDRTLNESIKSTKLKSVDLSLCSEITDTNIWTLCKNNPYIKKLKLTHCTQITNEGVRVALHMLNEIELLDLEGIKKGDCSFFSEYFNLNMTSSINLKHLNKLIFSGSNDFNNSIMMKKLFKNCINLKELSVLYSSSSSIQNGIDSPLKYMPVSLVSLSLYRPNIVNSQLFVNSLKSLINLEILSLYCVECLNDKYLVQILENNGSNLNTLNLGGYMALPGIITNESLKHLYKYCKQLTTISFDFLSVTLSFESLMPYFEQTNYAAKFEVINFSACRNTSKDLLQQICLNCSHLIKLDLSGLNDLVDDNLIELLAQSASNLKYFDIKGCTQVTDRSISQLVTKCTKIKSICLAGINALTDKCIFSIANNLQLSLNEIYLSGCTRISSAALNYLTDCCVNHLYYEHRVPNIDPKQLMARNLNTGFFERVDLL